MEKNMDFSTTNQEESIGTCIMQEDGTLVLRLQATGEGGLIGQGTLEYKTDHPNYTEILDHVGPIQPGQTKPVAPWD